MSKMSEAITEALQALREGRPVLVLDDVDRENEDDVVLAAQTITPAWMGWTIRHSSGYVCVPMPAAWADRLELPSMVPHNQDPRRTAYTVTVDAAAGITTGISASDRALTVALLGSPETMLGKEHDLPVLSVADVVGHRQSTEGRMGS